MNPHGVGAELRSILESICENRLTGEQARRLEALTLDDPAALRYYLDYIELHGNLHWDAAQGHVAPVDAVPIEVCDTVRRLPAPTTRERSFRFVTLTAAAVAGMAIVALAAWWVARPQMRDNAVAIKHDKTPDPGAQPASTMPVSAPGDAAGSAKSPSPAREAVAIARADEPAPSVGPSASLLPRGGALSSPILSPKADMSQAPAEPDDGDDAADASGPVVFVDARIRASWKHAGIEPSPVAPEGEWIRRVFLDVVGHIPDEAAVNSYLEYEGPPDRSRPNPMEASARAGGGAPLDATWKQRRAAVVERLLNDSAYPRNWTTVWANLLVGRQPHAPGVSREALEKFLRDRFAANTPWNEVVYELIAAEGSSEQSPAANYLLAHLNNDAVPATAITARLFLGVQIQCTQCHDHPFQNDKQNRFWELNSFFQQTEMVDGTKAGTAVGMTQLAGLVNRSVGGPTYYETLRGEMRAAFPVYAGHKVDPAPNVNRRRELARLIARGDDRQLALALVNRMWEHFFGYGFTRPIDDMGPHNPATHPDVLDRLAKEFIASSYDVKQLIRWICETDAYQRSSTIDRGNAADDPTTGAAPLFSRVYLKPLSAEQLYDSLLVATRAKLSARTDWNDVGRRRQDWVRQFIINYGTDENDETTTFGGAVSQALLMMNDPIVQGALRVEPGTLLFDVAHDPSDDAGKVRRLCRSALARNPTDAELRFATDHLQMARGAGGRSKSKPRAGHTAESEALQDVFWAFLNANEFATVH